MFLSFLLFFFGGGAGHSISPPLPIAPIACFFGATGSDSRGLAGPGPRGAAAAPGGPHRGRLAGADARRGFGLRAPFEAPRALRVSRGWLAKGRDVGSRRSRLVGRDPFRRGMRICMREPFGAADRSSVRTW